MIMHGLAPGVSDAGNSVVCGEEPDAKHGECGAEPCDVADLGAGKPHEHRHGDDGEGPGKGTVGGRGLCEAERLSNVAAWGTE